jgi:hypothetical protein
LFPFVHYTGYQFSVCLPYTFYIYSYRFFAHGNRYSFLMTIDQRARTIENLDSLPLGCDLSAVIANMDFFPDTTTLSFENGPEGLRYAVIKPGEGEPARSGTNVSVHYTGWLVNGHKFDSSRDRGQELRFPLGGGHVIRGWDLGIAGMLPGEKRILIIPPGLGYGSRAHGPIPGGSTLIFAVEYLGE